MFRIIDIFKKLFSFLNKKEKKTTLWFMFFLTIAAGLEVIGITLVLPFIAMISDPEIIHKNAILNKIYSSLQLDNSKEGIIYTGILLFSVYLFKNLYFAVLYYYQFKFLAQKKTSLVSDLYSYYLKCPYSFHLNSNPADLFRNVNAAGKVIDQVWKPLTILVTEFLVLFILIAFLISLSPLATLTAILIVGLLVGGFYKLVHMKVAVWTRKNFHYSGLMTKWFHQGIGGIKEVKVQGKELFFTKEFRNYTDHVNYYNRAQNTINQFPRLFIETVLISAVIGFVIITVQYQSNLSLIIPTIAVFAAAAIRFLPSMNRILLASLQLRSGLVTVDLVYENQNKKIQLQEFTDNGNDDAPALSFKSNIELKNISFQYLKSNQITIQNVSLNIAKGQTVGFAGPSGAGKTTIVDLILGILQPDSGKIQIDGQDFKKFKHSWPKLVGYIPQTIFLCDDTVRKNVAFGLPNTEINDERVWAALKSANLDDFVRSMPKGLDTEIGDRGIRISGGQRQRVGIARAMYHDPEILVLDEATSSLDNETEQAVSKAIQSLFGKKTILIIAHRLSTITNCDKIFFFKGGKLLDTGSYETLITKNSDFRNFANPNPELIIN